MKLYPIQSTKDKELLEITEDRDHIISEISKKKNEIIELDNKIEITNKEALLNTNELQHLIAERTRLLQENQALGEILNNSFMELKKNEEKIKEIQEYKINLERELVQNANYLSENERLFDYQIQQKKILLEKKRELAEKKKELNDIKLVEKEINKSFYQNIKSHKGLIKEKICKLRLNKSCICEPNEFSSIIDAENNKII